MSDPDDQKPRILRLVSEGEGSTLAEAKAAVDQRTAIFHEELIAAGARRTERARRPIEEKYKIAVAALRSVAGASTFPMRREVRDYEDAGGDSELPRRLLEVNLSFRESAIKALDMLGEALPGSPKALLEDSEIS